MYGHKEEVKLEEPVLGALVIGALRGWTHGSDKIEYAEISVRNSKNHLDVGIAGYLFEEDVSIRSGEQGETIGICPDDLYTSLHVINVGSQWTKHGFRKTRPKMRGNPIEKTKEVSKLLEEVLNI